MEDLDKIESTLQRTLEDISVLLTIGNTLYTVGPSYMTMEALDNICPGCLPDHIELNSFTHKNSKVNLNYALEAFNIATTIMLTTFSAQLNGTGIQLQIAFTNLSTLWSRIVPYLTQFKSLHYEISDTPPPISVIKGESYRKSLSEIFTTELDLHFISGTKGYKVTDLLATTVAHVNVINEMIQNLNGIIDIMFLMYNNNAYGALQTSWIADIAKRSTYLSTTIYSKKDLFNEIVKYGGFEPSKSERLTEAKDTILYLSGTKDNFWSGQYVYLKNRKTCVYALHDNLYIDSLNTKTHFTLFEKDLFPNLDVDIEALNNLMRTLNLKIPIVTDNYGALGKKVHRLSSELKTLELHRKVAWSHDTRYQPKQIVWPETNHGYQLPESSDVVSRDYVAEEMPRVILSSPMLIRKLKEIVVLNYELKDLARVISRYFMQIRLYGEYIKTTIE